MIFGRGKSKKTTSYANVANVEVSSHGVGRTSPSEGGRAPLPPSVKSFLPSLKISDGNATLAIADLRKIIRMALKDVVVDENWYFKRYPKVGEAAKQGMVTAAEHYVSHGYLEGRLPFRPEVDEEFYLRANPDIARAVKERVQKSGFDHFVLSGYLEGRRPRP
jgi:hypothetical protein